MFVKIDRDTWVNMMLVEAISGYGAQMMLQLHDGSELLVEESYVPDVKSAMRTIETIALRFKCGHF